MSSGSRGVDAEDVHHHLHHAEAGEADALERRAPLSFERFFCRFSTQAARA